MASSTKANPLTQKHLTVLNDILRISGEVVDHLNKCKNCNIDVSKEEELLNQQLQLAKDLKAQFFPKER